MAGYPKIRVAPGRVVHGSSDLIKPIRDYLSGGKFLPGQFLPPIRTLADELGASYETVRRSLKQLEVEGLVEAVPRQGFRICAAADDAIANRPVAYVTDCSSDLSDAQPTTWAISRSLQETAGNRNLTMLGVHCAGGDASNLVAQVHAARAWGIVVDTLDDPVAAEARRAGLPVVMVNSWAEDGGVDVVMQDNYLGGLLAARTLAATGAERIGWVGPRSESCHSRERFSSAVAGLKANGLFMNPSHIIELQRDNVLERLRALLTAKDRPTALFVLWKVAAQAVRTVADELGLEIGSDLHLVGWCVQELYQQEHADVFKGCALPPAVVWRASEMTAAALERLEACRKGSQPRRTCVPLRIVEGEDK